MLLKPLIEEYNVLPHAIEKCVAYNCVSLLHNIEQLIFTHTLLRYTV